MGARIADETQIRYIISVSAKYIRDNKKANTTAMATYHEVKNVAVMVQYGALVPSMHTAEAISKSGSGGVFH